MRCYKHRLDGSVAGRRWRSAFGRQAAADRLRADMPRNLVWIIADDFAPRISRPYGGRLASTPVMSALARDGCLFRRRLLYVSPVDAVESVFMGRPVPPLGRRHPVADAPAGRDHHHRPAPQAARIRDRGRRQDALLCASRRRLRLRHRAPPPPAVGARQGPRPLTRAARGARTVAAVPLPGRTVAQRQGAPVCGHGSRYAKHLLCEPGRRVLDGTSSAAVLPTRRLVRDPLAVPSAHRVSQSASA